MSAIDLSTMAMASKADVNIFNNLGENQILTFRCASGDRNLGTHTLPWGEKWGFGFIPNIWGTTLYHCNFAWNGHTQGIKVWTQGFPFPCMHCEWRVAQDGFYRQERDEGQPLFVVGWN